MGMSPREYQLSVKHRLALTFPVTVIVESDCENLGLAQSAALEQVAAKLQGESLRYIWKGTNIRSSEFTQVQFKNLPLLPIPEEVPEPEAE